MKNTIFIFLLISQIVYSQNIYVTKNKKLLNLNSEYYFPVLNPDGSKVLFTKENFKGLYIYDLKSKKQRMVSNKQGSGYNPVFSKDGSKIYYRWNEYEGLKKYSSIGVYDIENNQTEILENKKRYISPPKIIANNLYYTQKNHLKKIAISNKLESRNNLNIWVKIENQKLVVYNDEEKTILTPNGDGNYIWPQLSPDKTKILYTFAGQGSFISDLRGNILASPGYLNAAKWLTEEWIVGMKDYDNGKYVTNSDIYAFNTQSNKTIQLTNTKDKIEMYPDCIPDNSKIVYHTQEGEIYLITLKLNK